MPQLRLLHRGSISSVFCSGEPEKEHKIVKAYHKCCDLQPRHWLNISREVAILTTLRDLKVPGVVQLCGTLDDAANLCLVFEPCRGGDLYKRLAQYGLLTEVQLCKEVIIPLLKVLSHLHSLGITHRDVKPENIFFNAAGSLVLGDFGLAIRAPDRATSRVGTLDYMAPEVLAQPSPDVVALRQLKPRQLPSYDSKVDVWALGVLVYESLMGVTPFGHPDPETASLQAQFRRPAPLRPGVSSNCADFVARVLTKQAGLRPTAAQLLGHPWVQQHLEGADVGAYRAVAQQWFGAMQGSGLHCLAANIERVTSCPDSKSAADTNSAAAAGAGNRPQSGAPGLQESTSSADSDRLTANTPHALLQSVVQQQQQQDLAVHPRQRPWEKLVQQHRQQQQQLAAVAAAPGSPAAPPAPAASSFSAATSACVGRTASAPWPVSAFATAGIAATPACSALQPPMAVAAAAGQLNPACSAATAQLNADCKSPAAAGASPAFLQGPQQLAGASSLPSALQQLMLCSSTPASPVTDRSSPGFWLLSPQQPAAKQVAGTSWAQQQQPQQPAILAGLPMHAAGKLQLRRPPAAAAAAVAGPPAGATAANAHGVLQCHVLASPMQAQIAAWPAGAVPLSPVAIVPPAAATANTSSCFQMLSPCKPAAAASPARPRVLAPTPTPCLVRHASAGLILQPSHCASLPPAPLPYRPAAPRVQRELLQSTGGPPAAAAAGVPAGERSVQLNVPAQQAKVLLLLPHAGSSRGSSSGCGGVDSGSDCSSRSSSPEVPCSTASPEPDVAVGSCHDCCVGLGLLPASYTAAKQMTPSLLNAATDTVEADQQQHTLDKITAATAAACKSGACCDADLSHLGQLLVASHSSAALAAAASAAAALPTATATSAATGAAGNVGIGVSNFGMTSNRGGSHRVAESDHPVSPVVKQQVALEEELAAAKKTRARTLWKKVQGVCKMMVAKPRSLAA